MIHEYPYTDFHEMNLDWIIREMKAARPDLNCSYYIGYCMDTPDLPEFLRFSREYQAPAAKFLQMNGFAFRSDQELAELMDQVGGLLPPNVPRQRDTPEQSGMTMK